MIFWLWMEKHLESSIGRKELPLDWVSFKVFMATITLSWKNLFWLRLQLISLLILSYLCNSKFQNYQWNKSSLFKHDSAIEPYRQKRKVDKNCSEFDEWKRLNAMMRRLRDFSQIIAMNKLSAVRSETRPLHSKSLKRLKLT